MTVEKQTILVVDDEPNNIRLLNHMLGTSYTVRVAVSGREALKRAVINPFPDLILLDIMMPVMDGYETCGHLKSNTDTADIPVIFLTAKTHPDDIVKGFEFGAVDYLTKPFNREELLARVKTHLEIKSGREKIQRQNRELIKAAALREDIERILHHDMRNALGAIVNLPKLLLKEAVTKKGRRHVQRLSASIDRLSNMVNLSLDLFKMEKNQYTPEMSPVDILFVVNTINAEVQKLKDERNISIKIVVRGSPARDKDTFIIPGEQLLFYTMLLNLIKNAIEASPENGVVTIDLDSGPALRIRIHNMGVVPREIRHRFFEKYATAKKDYGTGLGTYSAKWIARAQNGKIKMTTSREKGTAVTISFPAPSEEKPDESG